MQYLVYIYSEKLSIAYLNLNWIECPKFLFVKSDSPMLYSSPTCFFGHGRLWSGIYCWERCAVADQIWGFLPVSWGKCLPEALCSLSSCTASARCLRPATSADAVAKQCCLGLGNHTALEFILWNH